MHNNRGYNNQKFNYVRFSSPEQRLSAHGSAGIRATDEHVHS